MDKDIKTIQKNKIEQIRISLSEFKGYQLANLRVYFKTEENDDEYKPTKKGISFRVNLLPEIIEGLTQAEKEIKKEDLESKTE